MKIYKCDAALCDKQCEESKMVTLKGYIGLSGGILLPERFQEKHFCDGKCFEEWLILEVQVCAKEICVASSQDIKMKTDRQKVAKLMSELGVEVGNSMGESNDIVVDARIGNVWFDFDENGKFKAIMTGE